ncbi:FliH/SctL family protein [Naasia sp. SYSU D00948]|uniref:FliH/SctL family protein n=1 Tax=Naasia sp. SYSU D00948 TaxID=2817379 RepID=UPI001B30DF78|nr:FliH/SctL family protein [Naasia sp. SYSU D00948]
MSTDFAPLAYPVLRDDAARGIEERARIQGHAAGYAAGRREAAATLESERAARQAEHDRVLTDGRARIQSAAAALSAGAAQLAAATAPVLAEADAALLSAAVELAEALLLRELDERPDAPLARVRRVLAAAAGSSPLRVRLAPADAELAGPSIGDVTVVPDPSLRPGDAVVDLPDGVLDARVGAALERARAALQVLR